jgi:hypothetical protein
MKATIIIIFVNILIGCSSSMPQKINPSDISENSKLAAYNFAKEQFESCKTGKYPKLTSDTSTPHLVKSLTIEDMKSACEKINKDCGELQKLNLQEILRDKESYIFRYKAKYSATDRQPEIRVYTNFNHKFDGIIYKPNWQDNYTPFNP